ncbi:MAG: motility associated factor glycosyltransferase family protein [Syntrophomonadaceae bacterium]|nr:motility associated factor glycosyltransferase family protein [Syntrophomonadaceae bacterium]
MSKKTKKKNRLISKTIDNNPPVRLVRVDNSRNADNSIYHANMQALKIHYPSLATKIEQTPKNNKFVISRVGSQATLNLYSREGNFYYYNIDDPLADVAAQIKALKLKNARLAVFLGMGLGYELRHYVQNESEKQNTVCILVIEKELEVFKAALENTDLSGIIRHPHLRLFVGLEEGDLYTNLREYLHESNRFFFLKAIKAVYHPSSLRLNKDYYIRALQLLKDAGSQQLLHFGNDPYDSLIGIENMLANLDEIISNPGINLLYNRFAGKPAIVVATGPSLNKNKHLLKGLENKAVIVAADASLRVLIDMGIKPHLVTSLERVMPTVKLLEGFNKEEVEDVYLAACPVVRNELYQVYPGPRVIVYRDFDHFKWLGIDRGILKIQLSAGNMAFKVAEALGCDPIILIGQDLAFSRDGRTHAYGTTYGEKQVSSGVKILTVPGNDGKPIETTSTWYSFLRAYEMDLLNYSGTCINATEGGAYITSSTVMSFQEAIAKHIQEEFCPRRTIRERLTAFTPQNVEQDLQQILKLTADTIKDLEQVVEYCRQGISSYEKYKDELESCLYGSANMKSIIKKLSMIEREIMEYKEKCRQLHHTFQLFFAHVFQSFAIKFEMEMIAVPEKYKDPDMARIEIILRQAEWYAVIGDLAAICLNSLRNSREMLQRNHPAVDNANSPEESTFSQEAVK